MVVVPNFHLFGVGADEDIAASSILLDSSSSGLKGRVRYINLAGIDSIESSRATRATEKGYLVGSSGGTITVVGKRGHSRPILLTVARRLCTGV